MLPIAAALVTTAGALILLMGMTHVTAVAQYSADVIILFGLALAVDYSLLADALSAAEECLRLACHTALSRLQFTCQLAGHPSGITYRDSGTDQHSLN